MKTSTSGSADPSGRSAQGTPPTTSLALMRPQRAALGIRARVARQSRAGDDRDHLPAGLILELATRGGFEVAAERPAKQPVRCLLHDDQHASAFLDSDRNIFFCSVCTPAGGWSARRFAEALGQPWTPANWPSTRGLAQPTRPAAAAFTPADAQAVWSAALARARDDGTCDVDRPVYEYLRGRGIADAWEEVTFGVLAAGMDLPVQVAGWPHSGHVLVVPLYDATGAVANIQARAIRPANKKTLFPAGSRAKRMMFASRTGLSVLKGAWSGPRQLVIAEGLTDFLTLCITSPVPVLAVPGAGLAASAIDSWIAGFDVWLALDADVAGATALAPTAAAASQHGARNIWRIDWPGHAKDACDVIQRRGIAALADYLDRVLVRGLS